MNVRVNIYNISSITCIDTYLPIIQVEQRHFQIMKPWNFQLQVGDVDADSGPQCRQFWGPQNWRNTWYPDTSIFAPVFDTEYFPSQDFLSK